MEESMKDQYPAVELAYPLAQNAFETIFKRVDALENRIQSVMTVAVTITLAVPVATSGKGLSYREPLFVTGMVLFIIAISVGMTARLRGEFRVVDPTILYQESLHKSEWEFKKDLIYWLGVNLNHNNALLLQRASLLNWMSFLLAAEAVALAAWAAPAFELS